jgi:hypothetical protein
VGSTKDFTERACGNEGGFIIVYEKRQDEAFNATVSWMNGDRNGVEFGMVRGDSGLQDISRMSERVGFEIARKSVVARDLRMSERNIRI